MLRILGLDVGDRRIGVAISDALGLTAQPLMVLERRSAAQDRQALQRVVTTHHVDAMVVGLPLTLRGEHGPQAQKVTAFVTSLRGILTIPIHVMDERLTTVQGERTLRTLNAPARARKQVIDQVAAQLILQQFLDRQRAADQHDEAHPSE